MASAGDCDRSHPRARALAELVLVLGAGAVGAAAQRLIPLVA